MTSVFAAISLNDFIANALAYEKSISNSNLVVAEATYNLKHNQHSQCYQYNTCTVTYYYHDQYKHENYAHTNTICTKPPPYPVYETVYYPGYSHTDWIMRGEYSDSSHSQSMQNTNDYYYEKVGYDHQNYIPSIPYIYNEAQKDGTPLRDTATVTVYSYDANTQDNLGTQDTQSRDVFFSVELKKVSSANGKTVSAADAAWHYVGNFTQSPLVGGNEVTHSPIAAQKADNTGKATFAINTRNPFGKTGTVDYLDEEGVYQLRVVAWNTYRSENGVTKYYISSTRYETLEFKQNYAPELSLTNESNILNFVFSKLGAKTTTPAFKRWVDDIYSNAYANAQSQTEGIFVRFSMRDQDTNQWQKGKAYLRKADGTEIAQTDVWFSENTAKGSTIVQSNAAWKTGYAYFGNWLFPDNTDLTGCTVTVQIWDYLNAACTDPVGTYQVVSTKLDIDTKVPAISNVTQSTTGLNTSTVKPGAGVINSVYAMRFKLNAADSHQNTKIRTVQFAITNTNTFPNSLTTVSVDANGYFTVPPDGITTDGTYYVHVYAQDYAGNEHKATYGPYTRKFEPVFSGVYLSEIKTAGKTKNYGASTIRNISDLGLPLTNNLKLWYKQGYSFTLRVVGTHVNRAELTLKYGVTDIPMRFVGYRKFELPDNADAILPLMSGAGNISTTTLAVDNIIPPVTSDADGHLVCDADSVYVAEYQVYLHRATLLAAGSGNNGKTLSMYLKLIGHHAYPTGHALAGQNVYTEINLSDVLLINGNATTDGGTNSSN